MNYQELMEKSDDACLKSIEFAKKGSWLMATFWKKVSEGFKEKARNLEVKNGK